MSKKYVTKIREIRAAAEQDKIKFGQTESSLKQELKELKKSSEDEKMQREQVVNQKNKKISFLEAEKARMEKALTNNLKARNLLDLENQIIKLANERQAFFEHKFRLENEINENREIVEQKDLQISMLKEHIKILNIELEEVK